MVSRRPVSEEIASRFLPTLWLTITSMIWAGCLAWRIGIAAAVWRNRWPDRLGMTLAVTGISFPAFALGMLLMQIFSVDLGWLPDRGADSWQHYILPSLTLGAAGGIRHGAFYALLVCRCPERGLHEDRAGERRQ
ncbi:ABC transporter permease [Salmonella enterica subsp. enterica serovar Typhimurium]|nr:ABC transporter permease [Salmonella enterica subsp. enterica serovar Typhimurium]